MIPEMLALHSLLREISTGIFKKKNLLFSLLFYSPLPNTKIHQEIIWLSKRVSISLESIWFLYISFFASGSRKSDWPIIYSVDCSIAVKPHWKCNFPMNPFVHPSVGWSIGRSVGPPSICHNFLDGREVTLSLGALVHICTLYFCVKLKVSSESPGVRSSHLATKLQPLPRYYSQSENLSRTGWPHILSKCIIFMINKLFFASW